MELSPGVQRPHCPSGSLDPSEVDSTAESRPAAALAVSCRRASRGGREGWHSPSQRLLGLLLSPPMPCSGPPSATAPPREAPESGTVCPHWLASPRHFTPQLKGSPCLVPGAHPFSSLGLQKTLQLLSVRLARTQSQLSVMSLRQGSPL